MLSRSNEIARRILPSAVRGYIRRYLRRPPVNFRSLDSSQAAIAADVAYSLQIGQAYLNYLAAEGVDPCGKTVLELGPGINFGSALLLASHGACPIVADRFLVRWDPHYHPKFYNALRSTLAECDPTADLTSLDRLIERDGDTDDAIRHIRQSAEDLQGIRDSSVDVIVSNAVLEHLFDLPGACREIGRVSKPLAWGFHQVDFRDHRDFDRPLEYLILPDAEFRRVFAARHGECGSRWRPCEVAEFFERVGFEVVRFDANMVASEDYLGEFEPRLRRSASRYRDMSLAELRTIGGLFRLRRRPLDSGAGIEAE